MRTRNGVVAVLACLAGIVLQEASAHSLAQEHEPPALIMMVDDKDRNDSVRLRYDVVGKSKPDRKGKSGKNKTEYVFGYFDAGAFSALDGKKGTVDFAGGATIDFAVAGKGSDGIFGTADDVYYRLSDAQDYADLYFRRPIVNGKSRTPPVAADYFGRLLIAWDTDLDGRTDLRVHLRARHYDGMMATPVPLPAAGLLFASGLVGLAMWRRRGER